MGRKNSKRPSSCFVPGCYSGYPSTLKQNRSLHIKNPALFSVKTSEDLKKWRDAIQRLDKEMKIGDRVCELHFTEDKIIKYYEIILRDGSVWKMERKRFILKKGAVPTLFLNLQNNRGKKKSKKILNNSKISPQRRKLSSNEITECPENTLNESTKHSVVTVNDDDTKNIETIENYNSKMIFQSKRKYGKTYTKDIPLDTGPSYRQSFITLNTSTNTESILDECRRNSDVTVGDDGLKNIEAIENQNSLSAKIVSHKTPETFTYATLISSLELLSKPDLLWGVASHDDFIMCAKWNEDGTLMKRVIIDCDLKVKVFLKNREIDFENIKINSITDLSTILYEIDRYGICIYVNDKERIGCDGYIIPKSPRSIQCEYCQLIGNWEIEANKKLSWLNKTRNFSKHQALYEKIHALDKKNALLQEQLKKLIKVKAVWKLSNLTNQNTTKS